MNKEKKQVTIYDIAARLDVSVATVSRALRHSPAVSAETRKKILDLAEEFGYQTNHFARNLRKKETRTIGVIIPRINSYFMATVIAGIERVANDTDYNLIISQSSESFEKEEAIVKTMFNNRVDGLLVSLAYPTHTLNHFQKFAQKGIPVIFFDRTYPTNSFTGISINNTQAAYEATKHLLEKDRRRIVHITVSSTQSIYRQRCQGYIQALTEYGVAFDNSLLYLCDLSLESGADAANYILSLPQMPDGIFVANDTCAAGCMIHLKKQGLNIPADIAIVGFNDDPVSRIVEPNLTTIHYPGHEMGALAARSLINHLKGNTDIMLTQSIVLRSDLIVRQSTDLYFAPGGGL